MNRQQNINLNHVSAKMYGNMKYREFYFFRIYKSTIVYFDISKKQQQNAIRQPGQFTPLVEAVKNLKQ